MATSGRVSKLQLTTSNIKFPVRLLFVGAQPSVWTSTSHKNNNSNSSNDSKKLAMYYRISVLVFMLHVPQRCRCRPIPLAWHICTYVQRFICILYYIGIKNSRRVCHVTRHFRLLVWRTVALSESKFAACLKLLLLPRRLPSALCMSAYLFVQSILISLNC